MTVFVTHHAVERYQERVAPCTVEKAREFILSASHAIEVAAVFSCQIVRLGNGARLVLDGTRVLTVYARHDLPRQCRRGGRVN